MAQAGSFETGSFASTGTETPLALDGYVAPMDGWVQSSFGLGAYASTSSSTWIHDPSNAQQGNRYLRLQTHSQVTQDSNGQNIVDAHSGSIMMRFGTLSDGYVEPGVPYGPALAPSQTYQLSFWARDFGVNTAGGGIYAFFHDHANVGVTYEQDRILSPLIASDSNGNAIPYDPNDPSAQWVQHIFTFDTTDGNSTLGIGLLSLPGLNGNLVSHTVYLDNFQLTPVPEPAGVLLIGLALIRNVFRRSRRE